MLGPQHRPGSQPQTANFDMAALELFNESFRRPGFRSKGWGGGCWLFRETAFSDEGPKALVVIIPVV